MKSGELHCSIKPANQQRKNVYDHTTMNTPLIMEVKHRRAEIVHGWGDCLGTPVVVCFCCSYKDKIITTILISETRIHGCKRL